MIRGVGASAHGVYRVCRFDHADLEVIFRVIIGGLVQVNVPCHDTGAEETARAQVFASQLNDHGVSV